MAPYGFDDGSTSKPEIAPGKTTSTPDAAALAAKIASGEEVYHHSDSTASFPDQRAAAEKRAVAEAAAAKIAARTPVQVEIAKLNAPDSDLWSKDEVKQKAAAARLRALLAQDVTPEEQQARNEMTVQEQRDQYGIEIDWPTRTHERNWSTDHEQSFYDFATARGWDGALVKSLVYDYLRNVDGLGTPMTEDALSQLDKRYAGRISEADRALLRRWIREEIEGGGGES